MKKLLVLLPALLSAAPAIPCGASAAYCVCVARPQTVEAGLGASDAVFRGTVTELERDPHPSDLAAQRPSVHARMRAVESWKGTVTGTVTVHQIEILDCDVRLVEGGEYIIYARRLPDGSLLTGFCDRSTSMSLGPAAEELRELRRLTAAAH